MNNKIVDYGWVPFPYFISIFILLIIISYSYYKNINKQLNTHIYNKLDNTVSKYVKLVIALIPIIIITYLDIKYSSFSMNNLGVTKYISNETINTLLKLIGGYCIIQVAAQDIGVKTGEVQADIVKTPLLQYLMYTGVAFSLTQNRSMSLIASLIYFQLKYFGSSGKTKDVCFE